MPPSDNELRLAGGMADRIGSSEAAVDFALPGSTLREKRPIPTHRDAAGMMLEWLGSHRLSDGLEAVGHRVIHGGKRFRRTTLIDDRLLDAIRGLAELAPLHNGPALEAIEAVREALGREMPMAAAFDTAFHRTMPDRARLYAIPLALAQKHHIERYGFHGLAHRYMAERCAGVLGRPLDKLRLITLQLGNGCSATAVEHGRSIDTSMGLTPLEGLVMGTRSGDTDPTLTGYLARRENVDIPVVESWLNTKSGLLGVSGQSGDMRELLARERQGDASASLAIEMFCYRARKFIGAYLAALGGADAITFGGGIGENAPEVRARILAGMDWCGIRLEARENEAAVGREAIISAPDSTIVVLVLPVDEALIIARETKACLANR